MANMPLWLLIPLVLVFSVALSWVLVVLARRMWPHPMLKENNEFVGFTYAVYGVVYGVVLGFTIVTAWTRFEEADSIVMRETTVLSELWRDAKGLSPDVCNAVHTDLQAYVASVIDQEWLEMGEFDRPHPETQRIYERLWSHTYDIKPESKSQEAFMAEYLTRINELSVERRLRLLYAHAEIHLILWLVMLIGAFPTVAYALLFATKHSWVHVVISSFLMALIVLCLVVAYSLQYPFTGVVSVKPDAFKDLQAAFQHRTIAVGTPAIAEPVKPDSSRK